jgi:hypothetical protein
MQRVGTMRRKAVIPMFTLRGLRWPDDRDGLCALDIWAGALALGTALVRLTKPSRKQPRKQNGSHGGG